MSPTVTARRVSFHSAKAPISACSSRTRQPRIESISDSVCRASADLTHVKVANLPLVAANIGSVVRNRLAKLSRHYSTRARRVAKHSAEHAKNARTGMRQAAERRLDDLEHARASTVRSARYWNRLKEQLFDPLRHDMAIRRELRRVASG